MAETYPFDQKTQGKIFVYKQFANVISSVNQQDNYDHKLTQANVLRMSQLVELLDDSPVAIIGKLVCDGSIYKPELLICGKLMVVKLPVSFLVFFLHLHHLHHLHIYHISAICDSSSSPPLLNIP
jgi:hypothetical protein